MSCPRRIRLERRKGWRKPAGAVVVARPSRWGNPWAVRDGACRIVWPGGWGVKAGMLEHFDLPLAGTWTVGDSLIAYHDWLTVGFVLASFRPRWDGEQEFRAAMVDLRAAVLARLDDLRGRDLACWCPLDRACHADVLLKLANAEPA